MWCVVCGVWSVECGVWCVVCGVWSVVCGVWSVVCGVGVCPLCSSKKLLKSSSFSLHHMVRFIPVPLQ